MTEAIVPKELLTATLGGLSLLVVSGGADGQVLTQQADGTYAPENVSAGIGGSVGSTDNRLVRSDGTGGSTVQSTGITVDDSNNVSGMGTLACGAITPTGVITSIAGSKTAPGIRIAGSSTVGFFSVGTQLYFSDGGGGGSDSVGFVGGLRLPRVNFLNFTSTTTATDAPDTKYGRDSGSAKGKVFADFGFSVRNFADSADAAFTAAAITASGLICPATYTVATLPSAAANTYKFASVSDSSVTTFGSTVAAGGSSKVMVFSNGTNWTVFAI